jgi:hypothetical protein
MQDFSRVERGHARGKKLVRPMGEVRANGVIPDGSDG